MQEWPRPSMISNQLWSELNWDIKDKDLFLYMLSYFFDTIDFNGYVFSKWTFSKRSMKVEAITTKKQQIQFRNFPQQQSRNFM